MTMQPSEAPRGVAAIRPSLIQLVAQLERRLRNANPVAIAEDGDVLTRWPLGRRSVLSVRSTVAVCLVTPFVISTALGNPLSALSVPVQLILGVLSAATTAAALCWCFPVGRLRQRPMEAIGPGEWIQVSGNEFSLFEASPVILSMARKEWGGDYCIGTQNGFLWRKSTMPTMPVVEIVDLFRAWRTETDDAGMNEWLPLVDLCDTVLSHTTRRQRTKEASAPRSAVVEELNALIDDPDLVERGIIAAKNLGLLNRTISSKNALALSAAGEAWLAKMREAETPDEEQGEADLPSMVRSAVEEALSHSAPIAESTELWDFAEWVHDLVMKFKDWVEHSAVYESLWTSGGIAQDERAVQAVAYGIFRAFCEAADVDLNKESNAGNGPVDFKFSSGWESRALLEIKLMKSTQLFHGAHKQLPQYMFAESINCGYYVCVGFDDSDLRPERIQRVRSECAAAAQEIGYELRPVFVDARRRPSASRS